MVSGGAGRVSDLFNKMLQKLDLGMVGLREQGG